MTTEIESAWARILEYIRAKIDHTAFTAWFKPIRAIKYENGALTVQVPSQFYYEWLESHHKEVIRDAIGAVLGENVKLLYSVIVDSSAQAVHPTYKMSGGVKLDFQSNLNERFTFDSFIEGDCNRFAKAASSSVAKSPGGTTFNPLLIYGGVGLGKTHLIQAIGNYARRNGKLKRVLYVDSERFTNDFINSIQKNKTTEFSELYRNVDLLIVDDVQFFGNKERTQDEFFHTFNALHNRGKQIVLSSDRSPKELNGIEERLISRFQWGLVVDIQQPDLETRQAILQTKAEENGLDLPSEILQFIATNITSNIRELEGALIRLLAYASLNGQDITLDLAKKLLKDVCIGQLKAVSIEFIQKTAADFFQIPDDMLRAKTRKQEIVTARQIAMYLCKLMTDNSLKTIGLHFGGRDHSTVIHAVNSVEEMMAENLKVREQVEHIKNKIEIALL